MSDPCQNVPFIAIADALQLSRPAVSNATPLSGTVSSFSTVYNPAGSSAWLLPSASSSSLQPITASAYLHQHAGTTMLPAFPDQRQISRSALSYPGAFEWVHTGSTNPRSAALGDVTGMIIGQDNKVSYLPVTAHCDQVSDRNAIVPLYPALSANIVQGTASQRTRQGPSRPLSYQEGSQLYYYHHNTLVPLLAGELKPCQGSYGSLSYTGSRALAQQAEMVMVLKEIQPTDAQPPLCTSASYYTTPAQPRAEASYPVMETCIENRNSLGRKAPSQALCWQKSTEVPKSRPHFSELNTSTDLGNMSEKAQFYKPSELLALPPAHILEQEENTNLDEIKAERSHSVDAYDKSTEYQEHSGVPLATCTMEHTLPCFDGDSQSQKFASCNASSGKDNLGVDNQDTHQSGVESTIDFADTSTIVDNMQLPQLLNCLTELEQLQDLDESKNCTVIQVNRTQEGATLSSSPRKKKNAASELLHGAPHAKVPHQDPACFVEGEGAEDSAGARDRPPENKVIHSDDTAQKAVSNSKKKANNHGQEKKKMAGEHTKKSKDCKQPRPKLKAEDKPDIPKRKRKRNPLELSKDDFKKPRTLLGMHMLESVQVFHALGKKIDKKTGVGNAGSTTELRACPTTTSQLDTPHEGKGPKKTQGIAQNRETTAEKDHPSPSQDQLPPPGKVKLVPLPFLTPDKPQVRNLPGRPISLTSRKPVAAYPARPHSNTGQPPRVNPSQPPLASTSLTGPAKSPVIISTRNNRPGVMNPTQSSTVPQSTAARPALQKEPVFAHPMKPRLPTEPQSQYLLEDFSKQPIPWRKVDFPGPAVSEPITEAQRPEREAMKRQAQRERKNAAKYTALGKLQFFVQREKDMEISYYYGYAM